MGRRAAAPPKEREPKTKEAGVGPRSQGLKASHEGTRVHRWVGRKTPSKRGPGAGKTGVQHRGTAPWIREASRLLEGRGEPWG